MVERLRALLERPLDPSVARAILMFALASVGFAAVVLLGGAGDRPTVIHTVGHEPAQRRGAGRGHPAPAPPATAAEVAGQDRQDRPGTEVHRRARREVAAHRALQHVPYRAGGVSIELVGAEGGQAVLVVEGLNLATAHRGWTRFLGRYRDEGRSYLPHFRAGVGGATVTGPRIIDLFAGAGGWEEGLRALGHRALGIEVDELACATARAAGHERLEADIAALDPAGFAPLRGLIGSPPCQAYSIAGKKLGRADEAEVVACARELSEGRDTRAERLAACADGRSLLTVEPLRWALALRPRWIALEQVPAVLGLWELFAELLDSHGYRCATGCLSAERYGVPQVRRRAFLVASLDGQVSLPMPTHRSFSARRHEVPAEELDLPNWVSMAEALGWGEESATLRSHHTNGGRFPGGEPRSFERPSFTVTGSSYNWKIERGTPGSGRRPGWARRRPATTVLGEPRVFGPGCWPRNGHPAERVRRETVRVTVEQASVLQGFRHDHPWQGPRTSRFRQIGNAVCPPVARAVLAEAMAPTLAREGSR